MTDLPTVLVIDDEARSLESLERILADDFDVRTTVSTADAEEILEQEWVRVVLCDQRMPDITGVDFLRQVRERWPETIRMIISGYTDAEDIIRGVNDAGIYQYITKPWHPENLVLGLKNAVKVFDLQRENELLSTELKLSSERAETVVAKRRERLRINYQADDGIIRTEASPMNAICNKLMQVAPFDVSVLLMGESGTGKELAARALHYNSLRWNKPFVVENCGALPDDLLESELFGHKRGAFTGAVNDHEGLFERANGGTVFLDEIGDISPAFQVKLLRVLQEGEIRPVGARRTRQVDIRVVAATNKSLAEEVRAGRFRDDLYYRLAAVSIELPALRHRKDDIAIIALKLLQKQASALGKPIAGLTDEAVQCLRNYHWPGNVRELQNELQHLVIMGDEGSVLGADQISPHILRGAPEDGQDEIDIFDDGNGTLKERIETLESRILQETLIRNRWNKSKTARELGLSRVGLRGKLERYGLGKVESLDDKQDRRVAGR